MDRHLIDEKLDSLHRCLARVRERCPATFEALQSNVDAQDIIALNLTRAVQICVDIAAHLISELPVSPPNTMGEAFVCLQTAGLIDESTSIGMQKAVGFRNLAVHAYQAIDWEIVFRICREHLIDFETFARSVVRAIASKR